MNKTEKDVADMVALCHKYETAMKKVIEMNYQNAEDQYGDRLKAKSWGCVVVLEAALGVNH